MTTMVFVGSICPRGCFLQQYSLLIMLNSFKRLVASALVPCLLLGGVPMGAQAAIVTSEQALVTADQVSAERATVIDFFARDDVRKALQAQGVNASDALARVQAMSDAEVAQLSDRVGQAPAGGDVIGVLFTVFVILLVTDILGFTKVFPFTRSIK